MPSTPPNQNKIRQIAVNARRSARCKRRLLEPARLLFPVGPARATPAGHRPTWVRAFGVLPAPTATRRINEMIMEDVFSCADEGRPPAGLHVVSLMRDAPEQPGWVSLDTAIGSARDFTWLN